MKRPSRFPAGAGHMANGPGAAHRLLAGIRAGGCDPGDLPGRACRPVVCAPERKRAHETRLRPPYRCGGSAVSVPLARPVLLPV